MPEDSSEPDLLTWTPILRYSRLMACIVTLTCGHTRKRYEYPQHIIELRQGGYRTGCPSCGHAYPIKDVRELPMSRANSPKVR